MRPERKMSLGYLAAALLLGLLGYGLYEPQPPIKVGVLHAMTGVMAGSERPVAETTLLAIEAVNRQGGIRGRKIEPVRVDTRSDWDFAATEAKRLIEQEGVVSIFGCWTSACRKSVKPVVEAADHLLLYPVQYEGLEQSPNILYAGAAPNQQIIPALRWATQTLGKPSAKDHPKNHLKSVYLVGSDYVFPRAAHQIIRDHLPRMDAVVVGEQMIPLADNTERQHQRLERIVQEIAALQPDMVINTINGEANAPFFRALDAHPRTTDIPSLSFSIAEAEAARIGIPHLQGHYAAWSYFESLGTEENRALLAHIRQRMGADQRVGNPMVAAWTAVQLWEQAVADTIDTGANNGALQPHRIREALRGLSEVTPAGVMLVDWENLHLWQPALVGEMMPDGQFRIVWRTAGPIKPAPWPTTRSRSEWERFLDGLRQQWQGKWQAPAAQDVQQPRGDR